MMMNAAVDALRCAISHQNAWIRSAFTKWSRTEKTNFPLSHAHTFTLTHTHTLQIKNRPRCHTFRGFVRELPALVSVMECV